ncbi:MAG TPA: family 16 glycoside hydrolase [Bryobacteraceae bacterium]|nr:family 16 glycoside hydrolase [Bryobacteraceae bacterium]
MKRASLFLCAAALLQAQTEQLFNGKDLSGWQMVGPGRFVVENGMMRTEGGMGLLWYTGRKLGNETLRIVFKTTGERDNSGVIVRLPEAPTDAWYGVHNGYEIQIDAAGPDDWHQTGAIYSLSRATKKAQKPTGEWNTMEIQLDGAVTRIRLNGELVNEFAGGDNVPERKQWYEPVRGPRPEYGFIGLQNHDPRTSVFFREISVLASDKSPKPLSQGERDRLLSYLHSTRKQIVDATASLNPKQWTFKPGPDKWSIAEVVEHLAATEDMLFGYAMKYRDAPVPASDKKVDTDTVVKNMATPSQPAQAPAEIRPTGRWAPGPVLTDAFRSRRDSVIQYVNETRDPLRQVHANWGGNVLEVYQTLFTIPAHTERHLQQINRVKADPNYPQ